MTARALLEAVDHLETVTATIGGRVALEIRDVCSDIRTIAASLEGQANWNSAYFAGWKNAAKWGAES